TRFKCDWSSDVCSSDLRKCPHRVILRQQRDVRGGPLRAVYRPLCRQAGCDHHPVAVVDRRKAPEVLSATWSQFDFGTKRWTKLASTTKQKKNNVVPLSGFRAIFLHGLASCLSLRAAASTWREASAFRSAMPSPTSRSGQTESVAAVTKPAAMMATLAYASLRAVRKAARVRLRL